MQDIVDGVSPLEVLGDDEIGVEISDLDFELIKEASGHLFWLEDSLSTLAGKWQRLYDEANPKKPDPLQVESLNLVGLRLKDYEFLFGYDEDYDDCVGVDLTFSCKPYSDHTLRFKSDGESAFSGITSHEGYLSDIRGKVIVLATKKVMTRPNGEITTYIELLTEDNNGKKIGAQVIWNGLITVEEIE